MCIVIVCSVCLNRYLFGEDGNRRQIYSFIFNWPILLFEVKKGKHLVFLKIFILMIFLVKLNSIVIYLIIVRLLCRYIYNKKYNHHEKSYDTIFNNYRGYRSYRFCGL